jgi:DNA-directed RNA polymerase beta subunit
MPPQKRSKKNTPAETNQKDHHQDEDNGIAHILEPSNITDQEQRAKLEALQRARDEKTAHILEQLPEQQTQENDDDDDDDDEAIDKELEIVQKNTAAAKRKRKICESTASKKKAPEKLEKLNQAKEQIQAIQREIDEMKEQENSSLWQESPLQNSRPKRRTPKENFFVGNGISQFVDHESPLSIGLQTAPWPSKYKPVSLSKYNGFGNSR